MNQTKGQIEAAITTAIVRFEKEFAAGRGPTNCRTYLVDELVLVHLTGTLTPGEFNLVRACTPIISNGNGQQTSIMDRREMLKTMRRELLEQGRSILSKEIESLTGRKVVTMHTDLSTITGDRIIVFVLEKSDQGSRNACLR